MQKRGGHVRREKDIAEDGLTSATILISKPFGHDLRVSAQDPPSKLDLILGKLRRVDIHEKIVNEVSRTGNSVTEVSSVEEFTFARHHLRLRSTRLAFRAS